MQSIISKKKFLNSILGGTFDHFHVGHKHFLDAAMKDSDYLYIGLAAPALFNHKPLSDKVEDYETRKKNVENYLNSCNFNSKYSIIPLDDIYGNALTEPNIHTIFTTIHSLKNVEKVNSERQKIGFDPLKVILVEPLHDSSNKIISSSRIRAGEIDTEGNLIINNI